MRRYYFLILPALLLIGCAGQGGKGGSQGEPSQEYVFTVPQPQSILSDEAKVDFVAEHFWDNYRFGDTILLANDDVTEQAFSDFLGHLNMVRESVAESAIGKMLDRAAADSASYERFVALSERYLYDPNSPMRNEEHYITVLRHMLASDRLSAVEKIRPEAQLSMAMKNRRGEKAADFVYTLANGRSGRMYDIRADYTLLFVNNPGCPMCADITRELMGSSVVGDELAAGRLKILTLYPDEEIGVWRDHLVDMPREWINGYDKGQAIRSSESYDLRAIPTLYLLDREKRVVIKDGVSVRDVEMAIYSQNR